MTSYSLSKSYFKKKNTGRQAGRQGGREGGGKVRREGRRKE